MHKYPSINQFRHAVKFAQQFDIATVEYEGTAKIHGTNTSIILSCDGELKSIQSRNTEITAEADFMGFAKWCETKRESFRKIVAGIRSRYSEIDKDIVLFGEWCGPGVQKGTAVNGAETKMWWIFGGYTAEDARTPVLDLKDVTDAFESEGIYHIESAGILPLTIDFSDDGNVEDVTKTLDHVIEKIEQQCPVGTYLGLKGLGEGMVFTPVTVEGSPVRSADLRASLRFKYKGEKHKATNKPKKEKSAEQVAKGEKAQELAASFVSEQRKQQAIDHLVETGVLGEGEMPEMKNIGPLIKWVTQDVMKEDSDLIEDAGLTIKDVKGPIASLVKEWVKGL